MKKFKARAPVTWPNFNHYVLEPVVRVFNAFRESRVGRLIGGVMEYGQYLPRPKTRTGMTEFWRVVNVLPADETTIDNRIESKKRTDMSHYDPVIATVEYGVEDQRGAKQVIELAVSLELLSQIMTSDAANPVSALENETVTFEKLSRLANHQMSVNIPKNSFQKAGGQFDLIVNNTVLLALGIIRDFVRSLPRSSRDSSPTERPLMFPRGPIDVG